MKKLHTFHYHDRLLAGMFRDLLAQEGVECLLRNDQLATALGEIPFTECYPELWVVDEETYPRAKLLLTALLKKQDTAAAKPWICSGCGESCEAHFSVCWSCGRVHE